MASRCFVAGLCCLGCAVSPIYAQDGRLEQIRRDVRSGDSTSAPSAGGASDDGSPSELTDGLFSCLWRLFARDDCRGDPRFNRFAPFPYFEDWPGYRAPPPDRWPEDLANWAGHFTERTWSVRVGVEDGDDFNRINRASAQVLIESASGLGVMTSWNQLYERLGGGPRRDADRRLQRNLHGQP